MFTSACTHVREKLDTGIVEVINKGDKPGLCTSCVKEMQTKGMEFSLVELDFQELKNRFSITDHFF
jgi:hypothetical protein